MVVIQSYTIAVVLCFITMLCWGSWANSIAVASGANANLRPEHIREGQHAIEDADILLMQLETPLETVAEAAKIAA